MCGIVGIVHSESSNAVRAEAIGEMCGRMVHRGPDGWGQYVHGPVGIGMRRLSVIDLTTGGQPISNEDGTIWVVLNGEIYNYLELRRDLEGKGHRFKTSSDTEVLVHLYEELGVCCVERLRGMFGFAVWDSRRQVLVLARDRVGIKPVYYASVPEGLIFASEIKAMLVHQSLSRDIDPDAVAEYFTHLCVPGDRSIFKAIRKLLPGHIVTFQHGRLRLMRYWTVQPNPDHKRTEAEWMDQLRHSLRDAVESHMVADVPLGAFLSGGLDSGAMVALMSQAAAEPIRTFSVGFATNADRFDERTAARAVAERYATAHQECLLEAEVTDVLPRIVWALDEPFADSSAIPNWLVCRETAQHVKVALSGLGGDELFGGYERYVGIQLGEQYQRLPRLVRVAIGKLIGRLPDVNGLSYYTDRLKRFTAAGEMSLADRYRHFIAAFCDVGEILLPDVSASRHHGISRYHELINELHIDEPLDLALFSDFHLYLPDDLLTLSDRVSMAHSLEVRVPFLDHELIELVARLPARFKVQGFRKKVLFRRAIAPLVPRGHLTRPKQGFSVPLGAWLRGPLKTMISDLVESQASRQSVWLNYAAIRTLLDEHVTGRRNHEIRLWAIICFLEWERQYANERPIRAATN